MSKSRKPQFADEKALHFFKDGVEYKRIHDDKDGNKRYITEVVANELVLMNK
jgi:hypothetical protein